MVFNNFFTFSGFMGIGFCQTSLMGERFSISGFTGIIFRKTSYTGKICRHCSIYMYAFEKLFRVTGIHFRNFSYTWMVLLRLEWHNPVPWKLKLSPPPRMPSFVEHFRFTVCSKSISFLFIPNSVRYKVYLRNLTRLCYCCGGAFTFNCFGFYTVPLKQTGMALKLVDGDK